MSNKQRGEIGEKTEKCHDTKNNEYLQNNVHLKISSIDCYYSDTDIIGFFPHYSSSEYEGEIMENSYYKEFLKDYDRIKSKCIIKGIEIKHEVTKFTKSEKINSVKVIYDEHEKKINSMIIKTTNKNYSYGNHTLYNRRDCVVLRKENCFIIGFKSCFMPDHNLIPHLSYIKCHFGKEEEFDNFYFQQDSESSFHFSLLNLLGLPFKLTYHTFNILRQIFDVLIKILIILCIFIFPLFLYHKASRKVNKRDIVYSNNSIMNYLDYLFKYLESLK